jgi:arsenite methyltransferase
MPDVTRPTSVGPVVRIRRAIKAAAYSGPGRDRWQLPEQVLDALEVRDGMRVADVGAGGGYFTFRLARAVGPDGRVYAIDTDADMRSLVADRAAARGLANVTPVAADEADPGLPEPIDLALIVDAFHHLPDPPRYLQELVAGHLAEDGRVAVIEPAPKWWLFGHATETAAVRAALEGAGLTVDIEHDLLPRQAFLIGRRPS